MFVTYQPFEFNITSNESHIGNTVSILKRTPFTGKWGVGAYTPNGDWEEWTAHVDELDGFDGMGE